MELYIETRRTAAKLIHKSTCQFYIINKGKLKPFGSGVCVKIQDMYFILTAAHVAEDRGSELHLKFAGGVFTFEHECIVNKIECSRDDDTIDIAVIRLSDSAVERLGDYYNFLSSEDLLTNHEIVNSTEYIAYGFPGSTTKIKSNSNKIDDRAAFIAVKPAEESHYKRLNCNIDFNIIVEYPQNKLVDMQTSQRGTGPAVYGMSGGGLWYVPGSVQGQDQVIKLVSILIEWPKKDKTKIISTRIDGLVEMIYLAYGLII